MLNVRRLPCIVVVFWVSAFALLVCGVPWACGTATCRGQDNVQDPAAPPAAAPPAGEEVVYGEIDGQSLKGFLVKPTGEAPSTGRRAMILIHEWWGLNDDIRNKAAEFAAQGYVALAVDLYGGQSTEKPDEAGRLAGQVRANLDGAFANLKAAVDYLKAMPDVDDSRMAAIGWCFGGGWAYQMAKNNLGVRASVIYYGQFNPKDDLEMMRASILGHFAEQDRSIRVDDVAEFEATLKTLNGDHEIYMYPNTTHGFASRPGANPNYDEEAARLAHERTLAFLDRALK